MENHTANFILFRHSNNNIRRIGHTRTSEKLINKVRTAIPIAAAVLQEEWYKLFTLSKKEDTIQPTVSSFFIHFPAKHNPPAKIEGCLSQSVCRYISFLITKKPSRSAVLTKQNVSYKPDKAGIPRANRCFLQQLPLQSLGWFFTAARKDILLLFHTVFSKNVIRSIGKRPGRTPIERKPCIVSSATAD